MVIINTRIRFFFDFSRIDARARTWNNYYSSYTG